MQRERPYASVACQRVEVHGEQHIGRLRLAVSLPPVVTPGELHVVPADAGDTVGAGGNRDNARAAHNCRPKPIHQSVVAEVIGRKLRLPSGADARFGASHDPGAVDNEVGVAAGSDKTVGERADASEVGQVEFVDFHTVDASDHRTCDRGPSCGDDDVRAGTRKGARCFQAEAGIAAGDDRELSRQIMARESLPGGRVCSESRAYGRLSVDHDFPRHRFRWGKH